MVRHKHLASPPFPFALIVAYLFIMTAHHEPRYVPARTNEGWPVVGLVVLLAAACIVAVTVIHKRTYKPPTDPTWQSAGQHSKPTAH
jgi:NADH:ubiquinone oxidoreductase subunit 6 (subunit J)